MAGQGSNQNNDILVRAEIRRSGGRAGSPSGSEQITLSSALVSPLLLSFFSSQIWKYQHYLPDNTTARCI